MIFVFQPELSLGQRTLQNLQAYSRPVARYSHHLGVTPFDYRTNALKVQGPINDIRGPAFPIPADGGLPVTICDGRQVG
jgi:hypothetical protein